jgi:hypothetical protein
MATASGAHKSIQTDHTSPSPGGIAVTPSDSANLSIPARSLYIGVSGNVVVYTADGSELTFVGVPIGILPVQVARVLSTGTTATNIIALK